MMENIKHLMYITCLLFICLSHHSYAVEVTIGFEKPINRYVPQTNSKISWFYQLMIIYPNEKEVHIENLNELATAAFRQRLPAYDQIESDQPFKIKFFYGHVLSDIFHEYDLHFFIPVDKLKDKLSKIRIFLNLDMSQEDNHKAEISRVDYL